MAWVIMMLSIGEIEVIEGGASYRAFPAVMFFVYATEVIFFYCLTAISMLFCPYKSRFVFVLDMAMMVLSMACASALTAVGYVAEFGNETLGWFGVCSLYKSYCHNAIVSVAFSYLGFICLFLLCLLWALSPDPAHPPPPPATALAARSPSPSAPLSV
ncbi:CASP-like protein 1C2 [Iris pallida]|nr:CASP-like protein 1C2 [Iris pallida]KAJ6799342.1 CASP-like protein 1C2 [Iris pallida]